MSSELANDPLGTGGTAAALRQRNSRIVLEIVRASAEPIRVAHIAKTSGLSRPTVETVVDGLLQQGWLAVPDEADLPASIGRPARHFVFNRLAGHVVGVDIGAHTITVAVSDLLGKLITVRKRPVAPELPSPSRLSLAVATLAEAMATAKATKASVLAMTVGTPGTVSPVDARIGISRGLPGWSHLDIEGALSGSIGCPVAVENDANLAAIGERERGVGAGCADMIFLLLGERLGAGVIANDNLVRGRDGAAGEMGYAPVPGAENRDDRFGALESRVNAAALVELGRTFGVSPSSEGTALTAERITAAATAGDPRAIRAVESLADELARGVAGPVLALNPSMLVIGGGVSRAGEVVRRALADAIDRVALFAPEVRL